MIADLSARQILGQCVFYLGLIFFIGYLADVPSYQYLPPDQAEVKLIVRHSGQLLGECREPNEEEQAKLPANMRAPIICPRERSPVAVKLILNGQSLFDEEILGAGLHNDGISATYQRFAVPAGTSRLQLTVNDNSGEAQSTYQYDEELNLAPAESVALVFNHGFTLYKEG
jgi:hypothetical protein